MNSLLLGLFLLATFIQLAYWLFIFSKLAFYKVPPVPTPSPEAVSVIICAHNEAENLAENLPHFLAQQYLEWELIVVNDHSSDKSLKILLDIQKKNPRLRIVNIIVDTPSGKKSSTSKGHSCCKL